jgi:hypothetical protein
MIRRLGAVLLALWSCFSSAHDLITAESAQRYLEDAARRREAMSPGEPAARRAEAAYRLGAMLDEIRELLNRDLAAHGEVQGLPSNYLVAELERIGVPLAYSARQRRFLSNTRYYAESLALSAAGASAVEAAFRLLQGAFYDSFGSDPLESGESWKDLRAQIELGEGLAAKSLSAEQREEADFILAVRYVRAARRADRALAQDYARKAQAALASFEKRYPDSLRAAAVPFLLDALSGKN